VIVACGEDEGYGDFDPSAALVDDLLLKDDSDVASGGACSIVRVLLAISPSRSADEDEVGSRASKRIKLE
jgi:hypothetical protein